MREVRVETLDKLEIKGGELRISANSGELSIVLPQALWEEIRDGVAAPEDPSAEELEELESIREQLGSYAEERNFSTALEGVQCGDSGLQYDLVLRPAGLFAVTTGYHFVPVVSPDLVSRIGASLQDDDFVEQAYVVGAVSGEEAFAAGDEALKVLSVRGRRCTTSRFEMAPELWQVLSERLGWRDVELFATEKR